MSFSRWLTSKKTMTSFSIVIVTSALLAAFVVVPYIPSFTDPYNSGTPTDEFLTLFSCGTLFVMGLLTLSTTALLTALILKYKHKKSSRA